MRLRSIRLAVVFAAVTLMADGPYAQAADTPIAVGEISAPPPGSGIDVAVLRDAAAAEIKEIDASRLPRRKKLVVSLALTRTLDGPVTCTVNAMVRDARTGVMIAIIEAGAHAEGPASVELRKQVAHAAVRSAVRRIPNALGEK